jgi:hypothetical protein
LAVIGHRRLPHGPGTAQGASSVAEDSASILRAPVMQDRRPGRCGLPDVAGDLRIQFAETGQDGQAAQIQNARSQPQSNRAHLAQAPSRSLTTLLGSRRSTAVSTSAAVFLLDEVHRLRSGR